MVLDGICVACETGVCSCQDKTIYFSLYNWEKWLKIVPILMALMMFFI